MERTVQIAHTRARMDVPERSPTEHKNRDVPIKSIALIDPRTLERECIVASLNTALPESAVWGYSNLEEWQRSGTPRTGLVLYAIVHEAGGIEVDLAGLAKVVAAAGTVPVVVIGGSDDIAVMLKTLEVGARGYVPSSIGVELAINAVCFTAAGGLFLPAEIILSARERIEHRTTSEDQLSGVFSSRQAAVVQALRQGKSNKIIAYELNMCENTVKAHVRTIMKKLDARNRTEAAFKISQLCAR